MMLVDTHAHLDMSRFDGDRAAAIERARQAQVAAIVSVGIDLESCRRAVRLASEHDLVYAAVGLHPQCAGELDGAAMAILRELAQQPKVVAVGEIGLDFYRDTWPRDRQRRAFQAQLSWAGELGKPVVIHDRDAHQEVLATLANWAQEMQGSPLAGRLGVLHTFSGDISMAERIIELGFYVSISGPVTYTNERRLPEIVRAVPMERLLVETDCPFLPPHPHRGQRNEPAYVRLVAERVADLRNVPLSTLAEATTANAKRLFGLDGAL
jgi:TatD DNase family protein